MMDYLRMRGGKIIWTMHNFGAHEARHPKLERWFWRQFIPRVDGAISLSGAGLAMALERFPRLREAATTVIPHGHYRAQYPAAEGGARDRLGIPRDAKVAMFFGAVRNYKNVDGLARAFRGVADRRAVLFVAGKPNLAELAAKIEAEAALDRRILLKFEFVADEDVTTYLSAADVVVLPYRDVLNSGSALLALSCNRPVLVPARGSMGELQAEFGEKWVRTFQGELDSATVESALAWAMEPRPAMCPMPEKYDWRHIGEETVRFYGQVISGAQSEAGATGLMMAGDHRSSQ